MTLTSELTWRGFVNQHTFKDITELDKRKLSFYLGVDPSSDSLTVGNLAMIMMARLFIAYGHSPVILAGGATALIGDPDGKSEERQLKASDAIANNTKLITKELNHLFKDSPFVLVDNYNWFKEYGYLNFLREVGKHVPMRQMLNREFIQSRLGEKGSGISYAEFSYVLIQAYDFLFLHQNYNVSLQICGSDQWGNSIAGVDLIRRITGNEVHVWTGPLIVNPITGVKFGKSEDGAIWLSSKKTSPSAFYQFWLNTDDVAVESYLKIYTTYSEQIITEVMRQHLLDPKLRSAQYMLADEVTRFIHGDSAMEIARSVTTLINNQRSISEANETDLKFLRKEITSLVTNHDSSIVQTLVQAGLASSNTEARKLIANGAIYINSKRCDRELFTETDFINRRLLLRRGKAYKDCALIEITN